MRTIGFIGLLAAIMAFFITTNAIVYKPTSFNRRASGVLIEGNWDKDPLSFLDHGLFRRDFTETVTVTVTTCTEETGNPPTTTSSTTIEITTTTGLVTATTSVIVSSSAVPPMTSEIPPITTLESSTGVPSVTCSTVTPLPPATPLESTASTESTEGTTELSTTVSVPTGTSTTPATTTSIIHPPNAGAQLQYNLTFAILGLGLAMIAAVI